MGRDRACLETSVANQWHSTTASHVTPSDANGGPVHDRIVNIAKNLKKMGMTANQISEATGLSVSEIEKI